MPPKRKANKKNVAKSPPAKKPKKDLWNDEQFLFSAKSKLNGEDLTGYFASPAAWTSLSEEEQEHIRSLLPVGIEYDENGAPAQEWLRYDNDWRNALRLFQEDVEAGRYEPQWLEEAHEASAARARGDYDDWKEMEFEEYWGQKSKINQDLMAGAAMNVSLAEMVESGYFEVNDVFRYIRAFGGKKGYLVEKDCLVTDISGSSITFAVAPGETKTMPDDMIVPSAVTLKTNEHASPAKNGKISTTSSTSIAQPTKDISPPVKEVKGSVTPAAEPQLPVTSKAKPSSRLFIPPSSTSDRLLSNDDSDLPRSSVPAVLENSYPDLDDNCDVKVNKKRLGFIGHLRRSPSKPSRSRSVSPTKSEANSVKRKPVSTRSSMPLVPNSIDDKDEDTSSLSSITDSEPMSSPPGWLDPSPRKNVNGATTEGQNAASSSVAEILEVSETKLTDGAPALGSEVEKKGQIPELHVKVTAEGPSEATAPAEVEEKEATPPGEHEANAKPDSNTATLLTVKSLGELEKFLLRIDGRKKEDSRQNYTWRCFSCKRRGKDLGILFQLREHYYERNRG